MYDFTEQKNMLQIAFLLLKENNLIQYAALGGGTALAAGYWNHRFSTDIDIFIYKNSIGTKDLLIENRWSNEIRKSMEKIGYKGDMRFQNIYLEFFISNQWKIQFFDVTGITEQPFITSDLWGMKNLKLETIEEIIAKKIHYRCQKGITRDIFDIALALYKDPMIFTKLGKVKKNSLKSLLETLDIISNDEEFYKTYKNEITELLPYKKYEELGYNAINYLKIFLESYVGALDYDISLGEKEYLEYSKISYEMAIKS